MYKEVLRLMHVLATCILVLLSSKLLDVCWRILVEVSK